MSFTGQQLLNPNPVVHSTNSAGSTQSFVKNSFDDNDTVEDIDAEEIFDVIRHLNDPEHPLTLEQLKVVEVEKIHIDQETNYVEIFFTPTIPNCTMATLIGLCIRVKLLRSLPSRFKVDIYITPGKHVSEHAVNKQLNDKERIAAALENENLLDVVNKCIKDSDSEVIKLDQILI